MKTKTLMTIAVASTFGLAAAAFAGSSHEVITPLSVNESGPVIVSNDKGFSGNQHMSAIGSSASEAGGTLSGSYSDSSGFMGNDSSSASLETDESLALADEGIYSDFYVVSWSPVAIESWDYYVISDGSLSGEDLYVFAPTHELALVPSATDEMVYELVMLPASLGTTSDEAAGG